MVYCTLVVGVDEGGEWGCIWVQWITVETLILISQITVRSVTLKMFATLIFWKRTYKFSWVHFPDNFSFCCHSWTLHKWHYIRDFWVIFFFGGGVKFIVLYPHQFCWLWSPYSTLWMFWSIVFSCLLVQTYEAQLTVDLVASVIIFSSCHCFSQLYCLHSVL